jgi:acyl-CoA thioester hydrolase
MRWGKSTTQVYFRYMEQVRVAWYERMFGDLSGSRDEGIVIVNASCNFLKALTVSRARSRSGCCSGR